MNKSISAENRFFLRPYPKDLKTVANLYLSNINNDPHELFYHTSDAVLLDKNLNIRGLYDLLNPQEVKLLEEDIEVLLKEPFKNKI